MYFIHFRHTHQYNILSHKTTANLLGDCHKRHTHTKYVHYCIIMVSKLLYTMKIEWLVSKASFLNTYSRSYIQNDIHLLNTPLNYRKKSGISD